MFLVRAAKSFCPEKPPLDLPIPPPLHAVQTVAALSIEAVGTPKRRTSNSSGAAAKSGPARKI